MATERPSYSQWQQNIPMSLAAPLQRQSLGLTPDPKDRQRNPPLHSNLRQWLGQQQTGPFHSIARTNICFQESLLNQVRLTGGYPWKCYTVGFGNNLIRQHRDGNLTDGNSVHQKCLNRNHQCCAGVIRSLLCTRAKTTAMQERFPLQLAFTEC